MRRKGREKGQGKPTSSGSCTAWKETFTTDQEAYGAFTAMVDASGLSFFVGQRPQALN